MHKISALISVKQLASAIGQGSKNVRVLDASWYLPSMNRNPKEEFESTHIPGAQFFDIDDCCDKNSSFDHMLPSPREFENYVGRLGISNKTHVVVYDTNATFGIFSAQRVWWTFRVFGHDLVSVLDGGFSRWCSDGQPVTTEKFNYPFEKFEAKFRPHLIKAFPDIENNLKEKNFQLVDARATGRFNGTAPEPRIGN
ncbi:hypothetical protein CHS0354_041757 [Potamilus streckersoni]|uniref:Rhodanese domain-containing protein n=1 Tax=Potamilus streckersoni TaxID=2493646 RepID=A0AAE0T168_9BIVA|nr:hypothetical protein CHS0354_041757 [Potamilus streckersoni]